MKAKEIMKSDVATCAVSDDVATAIKTMEDRHCGFLPIIDDRGVVVGVTTDRDLCLTLGHDQRPANRVAVTETMSSPVVSCLTEDNLRVVLATMAVHHVHRLPVMDKRGHLEGVVSIDDIAQMRRDWATPSADEIVGALKDITSPVSLFG